MADFCSAESEMGTINHDQYQYMEDRDDDQDPAQTHLGDEGLLFSRAESEERGEGGEDETAPNLLSIVIKITLI